MTAYAAATEDFRAFLTQKRSRQMDLLRQEWSIDASERSSLFQGPQGCFSCVAIQCVEKNAEALQHIAAGRHEVHPRALQEDVVEMVFAAVTKPHEAALSHLEFGRQLALTIDRMVNRAVSGTPLFSRWQRDSTYVDIETSPASQGSVDTSADRESVRDEIETPMRRGRESVGSEDRETVLSDVRDLRERLGSGPKPGRVRSLRRPRLGQKPAACAVAL